MASGAAGLDEAFFEYNESSTFRTVVAKAREAGDTAMTAARQRVEAFVAQLHAQSQFTTAPLYLPEVVRYFPFVQMQPIEMIDRLSRVLRTKPGHYVINYRKGDLKAQTRMSVLKDLARILFEAERARFPELGTADEKLLGYEQLLFVANLLAPKNLLLDEMGRVDARRNLISELSALFWIPKSLLTFQLQQSIGQSTGTTNTTTTRRQVEMAG